MAFPLGMVLEACPDLADYARHGISQWPDFLAAATMVRPMLGISPSAWGDACDVLGEVQACIVLAGPDADGAYVCAKARLDCSAYYLNLSLRCCGFALAAEVLEWTERISGRQAPACGCVPFGPAALLSQ